MRIAMFYHSLRSCWPHRSAHFLRGIASELSARGHRVQLLDGSVDLDAALDDVDLVLVHEWVDPALVACIGRHRRRASYRLLFHDTYHRAIASRREERHDLQDYDGVLAAGDSIRQRYLAEGWASRAWTWHQAADVRVFKPMGEPATGDVVWVGNWGDGDRAAGLGEFLIAPSRTIGLKGAVHGTRYPQEVVAVIQAAGLRYEGWLPNQEVPRAYARHRATVHIPHRRHSEQLPGVPSMRMFEALACGIALVSAPWEDEEGLFVEGRDYLVARSGEEMARCLRAVVNDRDLASALAVNGRRTIHSRHTCRHRVDQLFGILRELSDQTRGEEKARTIELEPGQMPPPERQAPDLERRAT